MASSPALVPGQLVTLPDETPEGAAPHLALVVSVDPLSIVRLGQVQDYGLNVAAVATA